MKKIVIVANDVSMPGEKGLARLHYLAEYFTARGFETELVTADFQHWEKRKRTPEDMRRIRAATKSRVTFLPEQPYQKNIDPRRILSLFGLSRRVAAYLETQRYDLVYALVPDNHLAYVAGRYAKKHGLPFIVDVEDLWPEAMRMVFDVPAVSDVLFSGFSYYAKKVYRLADGVVGSSHEYTAEPEKYGVFPKKRATVYVGTDLGEFDAGAKEKAPAIEKPADAFWVSYAGTLGTSYDLATLIEAAALLKRRGITNLSVQLMGDGPTRPALEALAEKSGANVHFTGYLPRADMAARLCRSDLTVNSLIAKASQSIVSKIGDYLAAGVPMVNTGLNPEFREKVEADGFGVNVAPENAAALAHAIEALYRDPAKRAEMGRRARAIAESQFDREKTYNDIVSLAKALLA